MTTTNLLGYAAGSLTTLAFVPQVLRTWKTRSARDLSWGMLLIFILGVILWLAYGLAVGSWPIIVCNSLTLGLNLVIAGVKAQQPVRAAALEEIR
ncbi:MAG: SemiSWEET transporter [Thermoanaerobaculia bacterium]